MMTLDLKIEEEVIRKLTNLLVKKDKNFGVRDFTRIFERIQLETNKDIHKFVIAVNNLTKELEPETKVQLQKIQSNNGIVPEVNFTEVSKALDKIKFASDDDRNIVFNYIKRSLN